MPWKAYEVVFRLHTPLHSGWRKIGNLQMTRPYITGRMLWGALTMRLTRDSSEDLSAVDSEKYKEVGKKVNEMLAFTYFYPALHNDVDYHVVWPWEDEADFRHRFLSSYASTALLYPQQATLDGSLHEVEFVSPHTADDAQPVYFFGYIFEHEKCSLKWRKAIRRLQLGGERGYGWGLVGPVSKPKKIDNHNLFDSTVEFDGSNEKPLLTIAKAGYLLAHTKAEADLPVDGEIEPLVGREWRSTNTNNRYAGQHIEYNAVCFAPGSKLKEQASFHVGKLGIWGKQ